MSEPSYHHGDLPAALVRSAVDLLQDDPDADLSLRAIARATGVSPAAPYRHFPNRASLMSAIAAVGYRELLNDLVARQPEPSTAVDLADVAVGYVQFAVRRPGLFRVMFVEGCDRASPERVDAVAAIHDYLGAAVERTLATDDLATTATGLWALVHGLAFLYLDGKLAWEPEDPEGLEEQVRTITLTTLAARPR
ncbi:WHG domain-containing protein [Arsenicicoccus piscis]|uniref:TetR/AcrR family transcriptional regulator n=1 Tax=Arsenicicoccus piscis TaxID=673954 RepID=UPI001F4C58B7|nr:WHG domain-containing protein [Arsenicicoccus piscis]